MVVADAISERAARFYAAHGFIQLPESMRMILPMRTIAAMIEPKRRMESEPGPRIAAP